MSRLLTILAAAGDVVRGRNAGHWRISRPLWTSMASWLGEAMTPIESEAGYAEVVRHWLWTFGPATEADLVWWLGLDEDRGPQGAVRCRGGSGRCWRTDRPGGCCPADTADLEAPPQAEPWVALLPTLDPTTMGWRERAFYLDRAHTPYLFDSAGNGGTTVWVNGRIVGCWVQDEAGAGPAHPHGGGLPGRAAAARRRGGPPRRVPARRAHHERVRLTADEAPANQLRRGQFPTTTATAVASMVYLTASAAGTRAAASSMRPFANLAVGPIWRDDLEQLTRSGQRQECCRPVVHRTVSRCCGAHPMQDLGLLIEEQHRMPSWLQPMVLTSELPLLDHVVDHLTPPGMLDARQAALQLLALVRRHVVEDLEQQRMARLRSRQVNASVGQIEVTFLAQFREQRTGHADGRVRVVAVAPRGRPVRSERQQDEFLSEHSIRGRYPSGPITRGRCRPIRSWRGHSYRWRAGRGDRCGRGGRGRSSRSRGARRVWATHTTKVIVPYGPEVLVPLQPVVVAKRVAGDVGTGGCGIEEGVCPARKPH